MDDHITGNHPIDYLEQEPGSGNELLATFSMEKAQAEFLSGVSKEKPTKTTIKEQPPSNDQLRDNFQSTDDGEQQNIIDETAFVASIVDKFPEEQRHIFNTSDDIECIYLGEGEISPELTRSAAKAKDVLKDKFREKLGEVFTGLKVYYVKGAIKTAGLAQSDANAIIMDIDKNTLTIEQAEELLTSKELDILEKEDWLRVVADRDGPSTISGETTLVHEFGHILQAKTGSKIKDTQNSPTKYGREKEWEDYAESFLYHCYDKPMKGDRDNIIQRDIASVTTAPDAPTT